MSVVIGMLAFAAGPAIIGYNASGADAAPAPLTMQHRMVEGLLGATRHMPSHVQYAAQALVREEMNLAFVGSRLNATDAIELTESLGTRRFRTQAKTFSLPLLTVSKIFLTLRA